MKKFTQITVLGFNGNELSPPTWRQLDGLCMKKLLIADLYARSAKELCQTDCLLVKLGAEVSFEVMDALPNLKYIGMMGTGYGGIDTKVATQKGVAVTNIADYATEAVAEFSFGILLEHLRSIAIAKSQAQSGDYSEAFTGTEIKGKTFGIVGLGNIGLRTAELAQAFGANVIYWSEHCKKSAEERGIPYVKLNKLLSTADILSINVALNSDTEGFIDTEHIGLFKQDAIVINLSPMELIDFSALLERLKRNNFTLLLDHSDEMTQNQLRALRSIKNCIIYPPIAYITAEANRLKQQIYVENLRSYLRASPRNQVN